MGRFGRVQTERALQPVIRTVQKTNRTLPSSFRTVQTGWRTLELTFRAVEKDGRTVQTRKRTLESTGRTLQSIERAVDLVFGSVRFVDCSVRRKAPVAGEDPRVGRRHCSEDRGDSRQGCARRAEPQSSGPPRTLQGMPSCSWRLFREAVDRLRAMFSSHFNCLPSRVAPLLRGYSFSLCSRLRVFHSSL